MPTMYEAMSRIAPKALPIYKNAFATGEDLFDRYGLNTPLRISHFLAQTATESGGFKSLRENMNYSKSRIVQIFGVGRHSAAVTAQEAASLARKPFDLAERVYGLGNPTKARQLGNTARGDGYDYRGAGPMQNTGKAEFQRLSTAATNLAGQDVDFVRNPDLLVTPRWVLLGALEYWRRNDLNALADRNDIRGITKAVNGGYNGFKERQSYFNKAYALFDTPEGEAWRHAEEDRSTASLQEALNLLGYQLEVDGRFGPATEAAVKDFQKKAGLKGDGIPGDLTWAAIQQRLESRTPQNRPADPIVSDAGLQRTGAAAAGTGAAGNTLIELGQNASIAFASNEWLQAAFGGVMLIGVGLIVWPMLRRKD